MKTRLIISLFFAGALAYACGPRSRTDGATPLASAFPVRAEAAPQHAAHLRDGRSINTTTTNKNTGAKVDSRLDVFVAPQGVRFALNVKNTGRKHVELTFPNGQAYDFLVVDSTGKEVWRWSTGHIFTQSVRNKQLGAGDAMDASETWHAPVSAGHYTAIATLKSSNYPTEQRVEFNVP